MKISALVDKLQQLKEEHGDIEVTCTHSLLPPGPGEQEEVTFKEVFETTVENFEVHDFKGGLAVRLWI